MKHRQLIACLMMLILGTALKAQQVFHGDFESYQKQVNALEKKQAYEEAMALTRRAWPKFPFKEFELIKEMVYLNEKMARHKDNLTLWRDGHSSGYFFLLNSQMKKYEPYLKWAAFDSLIQEDRRLRAQALEQARTVYEVMPPDLVEGGRNYGLLMILHGGGSSLDQARARWKRVAPVCNEYYTVYVQSYRHYDSSTFGWSSSDRRGFEELRDCYDEIVERYPVDTARVIFGGTSAGATMALAAALNQDIPAEGIIAFCPGKPQALPEAADRLRNVRVFMLGGEKDFYLESQQALGRWFDKNGISYRHVVVPGMGHEFPADYENIMVNALKFVTAEAL